MLPSPQALPAAHFMEEENGRDIKAHLPHRSARLSYFEGVAAETVGAKGICMHLLTIPPGVRAKAHLHEAHETAIYMLSGEAHTWYGDRLENHVIVHAGELFYIPAGVPHLPANLSSTPCTAIIARTDPNEQESVVLPELDGLVPA
ncbi:putative RmlC-like cupin family protein [Rhizobium leguminosarum]|nr:putative RmlC-like cupin family protein [Rhizobium leguminosarum]